ncbi:MAG: TonB-dependent receptor [Proteobacteria bacterium]|nr:TonB-dependent receptor [Pseudomonadota bacterium]
MKISALLLSASVLALGYAGAAEAQSTPASDQPSSGSSSDKSQVKEVVITAERRSVNLQRAPISATVLTGQDLENKGVVQVEDLQFATPSATVNNFGQGIDFNIRGIGKAEHNSQTTTGVITYRDGVATFPGYLQEEPYYDIARIEILRGPQGTFVGQNATGGAVFVVSNDPVIGGGHHGYLMGQAGNYADFALQGAVNLPISDTLAGRVAFDTETRDSFYKITGPGGTAYNGNPGDLKMYSARFGLLWKPNAALSVLWKTEGNYIDMGGYPSDPVLATNDPFHLSFNSPEKALDKFWRTSLKVDYVTDNGITFRSLSSYQYGKTQYWADLDGTSTTNWFFTDAVNERIWSQEFNIISPSTGPLTWILGAYYQTDTHNFPTNEFLIATPPGSIFSEYRLQGTNPTKNAAVFGQISWNLTDALQIQLGGRYSSASTANHVTVLQYGTPIIDEQSAKYHNLSGKLSINWTVDQHNFLYAFAATGYRPGGLNVPVGLGQPAPFDSEKVQEYEAGWKAGFFDGHLRTQLDAYYNKYENFQVTIGYPAFPTFGFELNTPNPTKIYGMEAQAEAVFGNFSWDAGMGLMKSELGEFFATDPRAASFTPCNPSTGPASASCISLKGKQQTYAPNFTFNIGAQYIFDLADGDTLTPRINYGHVSQQWASLFENVARGDRIGARDLFNAQLAWKHGGYVLTAYGSNLSDQHYVAAANSGLRFMGPPRQFGLRLFKVF